MICQRFTEFYIEMREFCRVCWFCVFLFLFLIWFFLWFLKLQNLQLFQRKLKNKAPNTIMKVSRWTPRMVVLNLHARNWILRKASLRISQYIVYVSYEIRKNRINFIQMLRPKKGRQQIEIWYRISESGF